MQTQDLDTLMLVLRQGSFASAARELGVDPSSVSRAISALEAELGVRLFARNTRHVALTEAGSVFVERLGPLLEELSMARTAALDTTGSLQGRLRVTVSNAFGVRVISPLLPEFCAAHPRLELDFILGETPSDLIAERIDVAVRVGNLKDSSLVAVPLRAVRYHVVASPAWLRQQAELLQRPGQLGSVACLCFSLAGFRELWHFVPKEGGETLVVPIRPRMVATNALMLREAALAGLGPSLLADWMIDDDLAAGDLVSLFPAHEVSVPNAPATAWAVYPSRAHVPAKARAFVEHLRQAMAAR